MSITSAYLREEHYYSADELQNIFSFDATKYNSKNNADENFKKYIKELLCRHIIREKKRNLYIESDQSVIFENLNDAEFLNNTVEYKFDFVGILIYQDVIAYVYPKYLGESDDSPLLSPPVDEMRQVMRVIEKYGREKCKQDSHDCDLFSYVDNNGKINTLSVILFLLETYAANGAYEEDDSMLEINGGGDIYWQKTIDETYPIISDNRPFYIELYTKKKVVNDVSYIKRLHSYVVTQCSREVQRVGLTDFYSLPVADISEAEQEDFGDTEYIITQIEQELTRVFDDRKISLLTAMKLYFQSAKIITGDTELQVWGTRSFNLIWEDVCAQVLRSQKGDSTTRHPNVNDIVPRIDYHLLNKKFEHKPPTLVELIEQPIWKKYGKGSKGIPARTLNPDYLRFEKDPAARSFTFYILDAKYYCPKWKNNAIEDQPGVEDVVKQYLYYLAYADILSKYHVTEVKTFF